jgi:hypothetical protein
MGDAAITYKGGTKDWVRGVSPHVANFAKRWRLDGAVINNSFASYPRRAHDLRSRKPGRPLFFTSTKAILGPSGAPQYRSQLDESRND